ncbi:hypothetical protein JCM10207_005265 [Rhodosporidiobolus poonsookiae]
MDAHDPPHVALATRLLRVVSLLSGQLVPSTGLKASAAALVVDELKEVWRRTSGACRRCTLSAFLTFSPPLTLLPQDIRQLLDTAISSLSAPTSIVPYLIALNSQLGLMAILPRLALPSPPSAPSVFSRLPAELVTHIVRDCQDDNLRLRQNTNLALASTCRAFHAAVQPIVRREVHLFTPGQLERAHHSFPRRSTRAAGIEVLSVDIGPEELDLTDASWPGRHLSTLIARCESLQSIRLRFGSATSSNYPLPVNDIWSTMSALGVDWYDFMEEIAALPQLQSLDVPVWNEELGVVYPSRNWHKPGAKLRHFRLGESTQPVDFSAEDTARHIEDYGWLSRPHPYTTLATPFIPFFPKNFLPFLELSPATPSFEHVEVLFELRDLTTDLEHLDDVFRCLSSRIRHLVVRFRTFDRATVPSDGILLFGTRLSRALSQCAKLEHLEFGGALMSNQLFEGVLKADLPALHTLVLLPFEYGRLALELSVPTCISALRDHARGRRIVFCAPRLVEQMLDDPFESSSLAYALNSTEEWGVRFEVEERIAEWAWVLDRGN